MIYRLLRVVNEWYALTVFWIYLAIFFVAFALVFVFPLAPIFLIFAGLAGLGIAVIGSRTLQSAQHLMARLALGRGICPVCRKHSGTLHESGWECSICHSTFDQAGCEILEQPL